MGPWSARADGSAGAGAPSVGLRDTEFEGHSTKVARLGGAAGMTAQPRDGDGRDKSSTSGDLDADSTRAGERPDQTADLALQVADMARLVDLNNRDIDALQTKALRPQHWWKDPPTLIALLALLVSMISPVVAQRNVASDREREDQRQLTDLVQQLPGLAEGEPDELVVVADTANRLMERVPSTPTQKLEVATALLKSGYLEDARRLLEDAASESTEQLEMSAISQRFANLHFQVEDLDEGRAAYDRAIRLAREALPEVAQPNYVGRYEVYWATDELYYADDCQEAAMHAIRAGDVVAQNEDRVDTDDLQGRIDALKGEIVERCA